MDGLTVDEARHLEDAASRFAEVARQCDPRVQFGPTAAAELDPIRAQLPISRELAHWYAYRGPQSVLYIPAFGNDRTIYPPSELINAQAGYRWAWSTNEQVTPVDGWDSSWIVIGSVGGDPIIADTSQPDTPILMSMHGRGTWNPYRLAPTLVSFLEAETVWITVCLIETAALVPTAFGVDVETSRIWNEQGEVLPNLTRRLETELIRLLPSDYIPAWLE